MDDDTINLPEAADLAAYVVKLVRASLPERYSTSNTPTGEADWRFFVRDGGWAVEVGDASFDQDHRGCVYAGTMGADGVGAEAEAAEALAEAEQHAEELGVDYNYEKN